MFAAGEGLATSVEKTKPSMSTNAAGAMLSSQTHKTGKGVLLFAALEATPFASGSVLRSSYETQPRRESSMRRARRERHWIRQWLREFMFSYNRKSYS